MENKKGRGIVLKDSNRDPNAGRCLETWLLRRGLPEVWGPAPLPDPGLATPSPCLCLGQLLEPRLDKPAVLRPPSRRREDQRPCDMLQPDSEDSWGSHLVLCLFFVDEATFCLS